MNLYNTNAHAESPDGTAVFTLGRLAAAAVLNSASVARNCGKMWEDWLSGFLLLHRHRGSSAHLSHRIARSRSAFAPLRRQLRHQDHFEWTSGTSDRLAEEVRCALHRVREPCSIRASQNRRRRHLRPGSVARKPKRASLPRDSPFGQFSPTCCCLRSYSDPRQCGVALSEVI